MSVHINIDTVIFNKYEIPKDEIDLEEEDKRTLPDRIKEAVDEYGVVYCDCETADRFFHAKWEDFTDAISKLCKDGYRLHACIEKDEKEC